MSKSAIHINVSGGNAVVGNVSQGNDNQLDNRQTNSIAAADLEQFCVAIESLACQSSTVSTADYMALRAEVESLAQGSEKSDVVDRLKGLYKKYAWATIPLKALLQLLIP